MSRWDGGLVLALGLGAALRLLSPGLQAELWYDEAYAVEMAHRPFGEMLRLVWLGGDTNPPLYTLLVRAWLGLGGSDLHLRLLSVSLGLCAMVVAFRLGKAAGGVWAGRIASLLLAASGWAIHYSLEVRPYALFLLLGLLSTHAFVAALGEHTEADRRPWSGGWRLYCAWTVLAIYTHWFGLLLLPAHALGFTIERRASPKDPRPFVFSCAAIVLLSLPLLPLAANQVRLQSEVGGFSWPDRPSPASLLGLASALGSGRGGLVVGALALGLAVLRPQPSRVSRTPALGRPIPFLLACLAVPVGLASAASLPTEGFSFLVDRYFLPFAAHGLVLLGVCLAGIDRRAAAILLAAFLALTGLDARTWAARRPSATWRPLRAITCVGSRPAPRLHLTPLTYLPARRYRDPACPGEERILWDPTSGAGYVLDYALRGELLSLRDLVAYPAELCRLGSFWLVSDPAKRGREGLLLTRLRSNPSFVPTASHAVGAVRVEGYEARCGPTDAWARAKPEEDP